VLMRGEKEASRRFRPIARRSDVRSCDSAALRRDPLALPLYDGRETRHAANAD